MKEREIKFRYTCKRDNGHVFSQIFTLEQIESGDAKRWTNENLVGLFHLKKDQYIGQHDKNDKEIYEGDIAMVECECGYKANMPVERGYNGFRLVKQWSHDFPSGELEFNHTERVEVIGTIHEHKHLLEGK